MKKMIIDCHIKFEIEADTQEDAIGIFKQEVIEHITEGGDLGDIANISAEVVTEVSATEAQTPVAEGSDEHDTAI